MGLLSALFQPLAPVVAPLQPFYEQLAKLGTPAVLTAGFVSFLVLVLVVNVLKQVFFKDPNRPPVVFHLFPFFGSTVTYGMDPYKFFFDCKQKYGPVFTFTVLGRTMTACLDSEGNDFVLNGKLAEVNAEEAYSPLTTPVFGEGVVYDCPNEMLMQQKKFMKFGLTTETFKTYVPLIVGQVEDYFKKSKYFKGAQGKTPLLEVIPEITIFTAARSLQGKEVRDALDGSMAKLVHDLDNGFQPMNFMFPWFPFPTNRKRDRAQRTIAKFYMDLIAKRRAQGKDQVIEQDMIWNLMDREYRGGRKVTDRDVAHMMIALLMAGQHTSMATISWMLLHLAADQKLQQELFEEQIRVFGKELPPLTYDKFSELKLLPNVIKEVLRMHPPLHSIMRKVKSPLQVPGKSWVIPTSHFLLAAPGVSSIDRKYFSDPMKFDPHRWDGQKEEAAGEQFDFGFGMVSKGTASPYLPFGAGRHRCIGEQFANVQLNCLASTFIREFELSLPDGKTEVPPPDYTSMITAPTAPAEVVWKRRQPYA